jgi:hypothetical protein
MATHSIERTVTKYEIEHHCLFLADDTLKRSISKELGSQKLIVRAGNKSYPAEVMDFYYKDKFVDGIVFGQGNAATEKHEFNFFFEQSVSEGKRLILNFHTDEAHEDGLPVVHAEIHLRTK